MSTLHRNPSRTGDPDPVPPSEGAPATVAPDTVAETPAPDPSWRPAEGQPAAAPPPAEPPPVTAPEPAPVAPTGHAARGVSRAYAAWVSVVVAAVVGVLVVIILLQNTATTDVRFLWTHSDLPLSAALLISALVGAAVPIIVGGIRMLELRRRYRRP